MADLQRKVILVPPHEEDAPKQIQERKSCVGPGGLKGVVKVPSLLFDIELEDAFPEDVPDDECEGVRAQVKSLLEPRSHIEIQLAEEVQRIKQDLTWDTFKLEAAHIARKVRVGGYTFKLRTALGGKCAGSCLRQLRHFFLTCSSSDSPHAASCVIDPQFREQFEIANPSSRYAKVLAEVPSVVVLSEDRLLTLVNLLSHEMQQSFQVKGATLPPWRQSASMMSKWRPRRSEDVVVQPASPNLASKKRLPEFKAGKIIVPKLEAFSQSKEKSSQESGESKRSNGRPAVRTGFLSSPSKEAMAGKRGRDHGPPGSAYSSLLASKLRGVASFEDGERLIPSKGQA